MLFYVGLYEVEGKYADSTLQRKLCQCLSQAVPTAYTNHQTLDESQDEDTY
jgi:hypothetical protein